MISYTAMMRRSHGLRKPQTAGRAHTRLRRLPVVARCRIDDVDTPMHQPIID
jgi:hypothetical protein